MRIRRWMLAVAAVCALGAAEAGAKSGETLSLKMHHINTNEDIDIVFKKNGVYDQAALKKLNWFMRDWRKARPVNMDPKAFELLAKIYAESGSRERIHIVCGYRSSTTNEFLRNRSSGVARESQHIRGKAIDFYIPGVSTKRLRELAIGEEGGGVGYYPKSAAPFVHIDVAKIRYWPKPDPQYVAQIIKKSRAEDKADDKPMPTYASAYADAPPVKNNKGWAAVLGPIPKARKAASDVAKAVPVPKRKPVAEEKAIASIADKATPKTLSALMALPKAKPEPFVVSADPENPAEASAPQARQKIEIVRADEPKPTQTIVEFTIPTVKIKKSGRIRLPE